MPKPNDYSFEGVTITKLDDLHNTINRITATILATERKISELNDSFAQFNKKVTDILDILVADKIIEGCTGNNCKL